jgi:hypothetical protein
MINNTLILTYTTIIILASIHASSAFHQPLTTKVEHLFERNSSGDDEAELNDTIDNGLPKVMDILSANFKSHALHTFVRLGIPDIMGDRSMSIKEISMELSKKNDVENKDSEYNIINEDGLLRIMRLLTTIEVLYETFVPSTNQYRISNRLDDNNLFRSESEALVFQLSSLGKQLQSKLPNDSSLSSIVLHWMEKQLNDSWYELPEHIMGNQLNPFEITNKVSSDFFYNERDNPQSLKHANDFVKLISDLEIKSIVQHYDWSALDGKTIVDVGGYNGKVMGAIASYYSDVNLQLKSLDLPDVIARIDKSSVPKGVELIEGDVMKPSTIPQCDVIFMKHFLDRCMWNESESVEILKTCSDAVSHKHGMIILGEAVIPSANDDYTISRANRGTRLSMDALYLLVGRERQRTSLEWKKLAEKANLNLSAIIPTSSPSCYLIVLTPCK